LTLTLEGFTPIPPDFASVYRSKGYWEDRTLTDVYRASFRAHADRIAVVAKDARITYTELHEKSERLACHLFDLGLRPLDVVIVQLPNVPEFVYLYFALQRLGVIPLMALPAHRHHEIGHYAKFVSAKAYVIPDRLGSFDFVNLARTVCRESPALALVVVAGSAPQEAGFSSLHDLLESRPICTPADLDALAIDAADPCIFQLSGGTTGIPKIIARTHNDYVYNTKLMAGHTDTRPDDALLVCAPIAHNFPLASPGISGFLGVGARAVMSTSARPEAVLPLIEAERITHLEIVPAMLISWLNDPNIGRYDLSSVRVINSGGQKLQTETKHRAEAAFPNGKVQEIFGMAEGLLMTTQLDDPGEIRWDTVGRTICPDDEVRLVDEDGAEVPPGALGELICRGPYTLRGYFRAPEANLRAFTPDGFFRTGDVMRLHPSGNFVIEGRKKDLINRGGEKISAEEVEDMLLQHPSVAMVACVSMPDPVLGERMCAFVVARPGRSVTLEDLVEHLTSLGLARFKHPEKLVVVDQFPISPFGKVQKNVLASRAAELVADGAQDRLAAWGGS
jgi:2,3-dihydroxybenzoate-AMP ligase